MDERYLKDKVLGHARAVAGRSHALDEWQDAFRAILDDARDGMDFWGFRFERRLGARLAPFVLLGLWFSFWYRARRIVRQADEERSGLAHLVYLRAYPAVLLLTAFGVGLTHAKRREPLHRLLVHSVTMGDGESRRVVDKLFLWGWEGAEDAIWQQLAGLKGRPGALSDHLCYVVGGWRASFAAAVADFEGLFDTWELLGALAYCDTLPMEELKDENHRVWMPAGRNAWRRRSRERVLTRVRDDAFGRLVDAGFGGGSPEKLAAAVDR